MKLSKRLVVRIACFGLLCGCPSVARAQSDVSSFSELAKTLELGTTVYVTDDAGQKVLGKVAALSASSLDLSVAGNRKSFPVDRVARITARERNTASGVWLGVVIGALGGAVAGLASGPRTAGECPRGCEAFLSVVRYGGIGAGIGAAIGSFRFTERVLYRAQNQPPTTAVSVSPLVSKHGGGIAASLRF
jgi:hypothetical protein